MLIFGLTFAQHSRVEDNIQGTPLGILYAGTFAVAVFFVLSGFVLSIGYFQTRNEDVIKRLALKRYTRLMIPALASILIAYLLIIFGGGGEITKAAGDITGSAWLSNAWGFNTDFFDAAYSGTVGIFHGSGTQFNNVLWTMKIEFIGSFIVFGFLLIFAKSSYRWVGYLVLLLLTFNTWYLGFLLGMVLADMYVLGWFSKLKKIPLLAPILIVSALLMGAYPLVTTGTMYEFVAVQLALLKINGKVMVLTLGSVLLLTGVLASPRISALLSHPKISILGKYTFALYLTHLAVLYTFTSSVFLVAQDSMGYMQASVIAFLASIPVVWVVTVLFEKYVDAPSILFSKHIIELYEGRKSLPNFWTKTQTDYTASKNAWRKRTSKKFNIGNEVTEL